MERAGTSQTNYKEKIQMAELEEIKAEIEKRCKDLDDVKVADNVKIEVVSGAMLMECCLLQATDLMDRAGIEEANFVPGDDFRFLELKKDLALALFESVVRRSVASVPPGPNSPMLSIDDLVRMAASGKN